MIKTQEKSTKDRVAELREKHQTFFEEIGKPQSYFYPKIAYRPADKDELYVSFFPSELSKGDDIYTEFINRDYNPEDGNRALWVLKYNPHWREEYEPTQVNDLNSARYLVPVSELCKITPLKKEEEDADPFKSLVDFVDDCPINQMTLRDFATIMTGKPLSYKSWLNKLITKMSEQEENEVQIVLPTKKIGAETKSPKNLIIFSKPKVGKTTLLANLDDCLIVDLENGSDYVDAMKLKASSISDIKKIGKAIKDANYPYKYVAVDTITALEEMCVPMAEEMYSKSAMGKNWFTDGKPKYGTILNMPNGAGYPWLREAFTKVIDYIKTWAPRTILVGHVKDTVLEKNGSEFNSLDLDLTGKLKRITTSQSDAIGYLYRKGNKNVLSFKTTDEISCGARPDHLRNQEIALSELTEDNKIKINWSEIYID